MITLLLILLYSFAPIVPLSESKTTQHGGCQAYYMEHRRIYVPDSIAAKGMPYPSNDWWTYGLVNEWTGKLWFYPGWVEGTASGIEIGFPTYWEPTGCEMKWDTPLAITLPGMHPTEALIDHWSDYLVSFTEQDGSSWIRVTAMHGSPLVWIESEGVIPAVNNPDPAKYAVFTRTTGTRTITTIGLLTPGLTATDMASYAYSIPFNTTIDYSYDAATSSLTTTFTTDVPVIQGFLPHHYYNTTLDFELSEAGYDTPRGRMRMAEGNSFSLSYSVHPMLPFFPAPMEWPEGYNPARMTQLISDYAARGNFGGDTYWGGKGLTQMMHYMTFALQMGDTTNFRLAKSRLRATLEDWYTYTPGEKMFYFARYPRWGALVGMDPSYDSDTFNDHHFHYGYFVYASAVLCLLDEDFRNQYGMAARELARDYACWKRNSTDEPWFRMLDPYCGHSFAGGMGNAGNGNGQESSSEAMQSWGGVWMLGAALGDEEMLEAGIFGYTLESRATAEYWFDRGRRNIDYTKYSHPYCCNLTMQGVGWWTWFSGDPVWMHSIQWLPTSPVLTNYLSEDLDFARWDYAQMYAAKEVGDYDAATGGLGDESGLGNVCLSYLALFDPDSAARVWDRADAQGKALAKNPDTGGITYWLAHSRRALGSENHAIHANYPLSAAYTTPQGETTYAVYNAESGARTVLFSDGTQVNAPAGALILWDGTDSLVTRTIADEPVLPYDSLRPDFPCDFPNIALHKPCSESGHENAGALAEFATDGDLSTRWGSLHQDNEWMQVDLGVQSYIDHVVIRWEAAYASRYELAFSDDAVSWRTFTYSGGGGVERRNIGLHARYVRLTGVQRGTQYGTSLYELEVYGLPLSGDTQSLYSLCISSEDEYIYTAQTPQYTISGYTLSGDPVAVNPTVVTDITTDTYTITATQGALKATYTWPVLEAEFVDTVLVEPAEATLPVGDSLLLEISALNQFGYEMTHSDTLFVATHVGDTTLTFDACTALIHMADYDDPEWLSHNSMFCAKAATRVITDHDGCSPLFTWQTAHDGSVEIRISAGEGEDGETYFRGARGMNGEFRLDGSAEDFLAYFQPLTAYTDRHTVTLRLIDAARRPATGSVISYSGQIECRSGLHTNDWSDYAFDGYIYGTRCAEEVFDPTSNLAYGKPANAGHAANRAAAANDGDLSSRWSSEGGTHPDDDWWQVDLGIAYDLREAVITWETARPENYVLEVSFDGQQWQTVGTYGSMPTVGQPVAYPIGRPARFVRVRTVSGGYNGLMYGISIYEFELYGDLYTLPTDLTNTSATSTSLRLVNGALVITRGARTYTIHGQLLR